MAGSDAGASDHSGAASDASAAADTNNSTDTTTSSGTDTGRDPSTTAAALQPISSNKEHARNMWQRVRVPPSVVPPSSSKGSSTSATPGAGGDSSDDSVDFSMRSVFRLTNLSPQGATAGLPLPTQSQHREIFDSYDVDRTGKLDPEEVRAMLTDLAEIGIEHARQNGASEAWVRQAYTQVLYLVC